MSGGAEIPRRSRFEAELLAAGYTAAADFDLDAHLAAIARAVAHAQKVASELAATTRRRTSGNTLDR